MVAEDREDSQAQRPTAVTAKAVQDSRRAEESRGAES